MVYGEAIDGPKVSADCGRRLSHSKPSRLAAESGADAIVFGTLYIANPDLVKRFERDAPLNELDKATFYTPGAKGYTDYPLLG